MSRDPNAAARKLGSLHLDDSEPDEDDLLDTPGQVKKPSTNRKTVNDSKNDSQQTSTRPQQSRYTDNDAREAALRRELDSVRGVNNVISNLISSLEKSRSNMDTVHRTVTSASTLLNTWTRILSQTEHNQRLILNPDWHGATQDAEDHENESVLRQQAAERRVAEEQMKREQEVRRTEEEERKKSVGSGSGTRGTRGRVRSSGYGRVPPSTANAPGYVGVGGQAGRGRASSRAGSGIGRGAASTRGRGRGVG